MCWNKHIFLQMIIHIKCSPTTVKQIFAILVFYIYLLTYISNHYNDFQVLDKVISNAQPIFECQLLRYRDYNPCNPLLCKQGSWVSNFGWLLIIHIVKHISIKNGKIKFVKSFHLKLWPDAYLYKVLVVTILNYIYNEFI